MENKTNEHMSIKNDLLSKIAANKIAMRPKIYFTAKLMALGVISFLALVLSAFIFNFIFFSIHAQATDALLGFGVRGIPLFITAFPWTLLLIDAVFILAFQWMVWRYYRGYRKPILFGLIAIFIVTVAAGIAIDRATPVNDYLRAGGSGFMPPQVRDFYGRAERPRRPIGSTCLCVITSVGTSTLTVENALLGSTTRLLIVVPLHGLHATTSSLSVGDTVMIAGDREGDVIRAFGIHKIDPGI